MMINMGCGPGFVNQTVSRKTQEGFATKSTMSLGLLSTLLVMAITVAQML